MPDAVHVTRAADIKPSHGQTEGMVRMGAIADKSDQICANIMLAKPHSASAVHHHGAQDTIVYAVRGKGAVVSEGGKKRQELSPGDFALIPAYAEHQEVNDGDEEVLWVIHRGGRTPVVENLEGWGASTGGGSHQKNVGGQHHHELGTHGGDEGLGAEHYGERH